MGTPREPDYGMLTPMMGRDGTNTLMNALLMAGGGVAAVPTLMAPTMIGGALGAARAEKGYGVQGAGRGALYGLGGTLGAGVGLGAGALAGSPLLGMVGGGAGGALLARLAMGQHPKTRDEAKKNQPDVRKAANVLSSGALGAGIGAGTGGLIAALLNFGHGAGHPAPGEHDLLAGPGSASVPTMVGLGAAAGGLLGGAHGIGQSLSDSARRRDKLKDDRAKRDEALADDMVKRQRGLQETFLTKYVLPRLAEEQGLVASKVPAKLAAAYCSPKMKARRKMQRKCAAVEGLVTLVKRGAPVPGAVPDPASPAIGKGGRPTPLPLPDPATFGAYGARPHPIYSIPPLGDALQGSSLGSFWEPVYRGHDTTASESNPYPLTSVLDNFYRRQQPGPETRIGPFLRMRDAPPGTFGDVPDAPDRPHHAVDQVLRTHRRDPQQAGQTLANDYGLRRIVAATVPGTLVEQGSGPIATAHLKDWQLMPGPTARQTGPASSPSKDGAPPVSPAITRPTPTDIPRSIRDLESLRNWQPGQGAGVSKPPLAKSSAQNVLLLLRALARQH